MNPSRFKYYLELGLEKPEPIFSLWIPSANGYSDVGGETLLAAGKPLPIFPDYKTWRREVGAKQRCGRCWKVTRGFNDLVRHCEIHHPRAIIHMPERRVA